MRVAEGATCTRRSSAVPPRRHARRNLGIRFAPASVENSSMRPQRIFLYTLVVSVIASALLGIAALLGGGFGDYELKIVLTTVTIALGSVLGLACGVGLERR